MSDEQNTNRSGGVDIHSDETQIGGDVTGRDKITISGGEVVQGDKTVVDTEGGAYVGGNVTVDQGSKFVGRDDHSTNITVGDITSATGVAIGPHAQATVTHIGGDEISRAFATLLEKVDVLPDGPEKSIAQGAVKGLESEARQGEQASEDKISKWLNFLAQAAPDAWEVAIDTFIHPIKGLSTAFRKIAERAKAERSAHS